MTGNPPVLKILETDIAALYEVALLGDGRCCALMSEKLLFDFIYYVVEGCLGWRVSILDSCGDIKFEIQRLGSRSQQRRRY
jgi:hypothetical protein